MLYLALPGHEDAAVIHAAVPPRAAILELGCGVGRVTRHLAQLGHRVTGVDNSVEMLAHVGDAEGRASKMLPTTNGSSAPGVRLGRLHKGQADSLPARGDRGHPHMHAVKALVLASGSLTGQQQAARFVANLRRIRTVAQEDGPYVNAVHERRIARLDRAWEQ